MIEIKTNADKVASGLLEISRRLTKIEKIAAPDMRKTFQLQTKKIFSTEGASGESGKWAKLSTKYREQKERKFPGKKILERTGAMKKDLLSKAAFDSFTNGFETRFRWETNSEYWEYHQAGTEKMPSRKTSDQTAKDLKQYLRILNGATEQVIKGVKVFDHTDVRFPTFDKVD